MEHADQNLSTKELMDWHRICRSTVHRLIAKGMPRTKVGTRNQFSADRVQDWFNDNWKNDPHEWPDNVQLRRETMLANRMYKEFNARFFRNRLPHYYVKVVKSIPGRETCIGLCVREKKLIYMNWGWFPIEEERRSILLHEMCHAAAPGVHGAPFLAQLRRLQRMGEEWAQDEVEKFCGDGKFSDKWIGRVRKRMFVSAISHPEWTWEQAWNHLGKEFSIDPTELSEHISKPKRSWKEVGELYKERIAIEKRIRRVDKLIKAAQAQQ